MSDRIVETRSLSKHHGRDDAADTVIALLNHLPRETRLGEITISDVYDTNYLMNKTVVTIKQELGRQPSAPLEVVDLKGAPTGEKILREAPLHDDAEVVASLRGNAHRRVWTRNTRGLWVSGSGEWRYWAELVDPMAPATLPE